MLPTHAISFPRRQQDLHLLLISVIYLRLKKARNGPDFFGGMGEGCWDVMVIGKLSTLSP